MGGRESFITTTFGLTFVIFNVFMPEIFKCIDKLPQYALPRSGPEEDGA